MERQILSGFCFKDACQPQWSMGVSWSLTLAALSGLQFPPSFPPEGPLSLSSTTRWSVLYLAFKMEICHVGEKTSSWYLWLFKSLVFQNAAFLNPKRTAHSSLKLLVKRRIYASNGISHILTEKQSDVFALEIREHCSYMCLLSILTTVHLPSQPSES